MLLYKGQVMYKFVDFVPLKAALLHKNKLIIEITYRYLDFSQTNSLIQTRA